MTKSSSGASKFQLEGALKLARIDLSGASSCQYKAGDQLVIVETDVARGSSLKRL